MRRNKIKIIKTKLRNSSSKESSQSIETHLWPRNLIETLIKKFRQSLNMFFQLLVLKVLKTYPRKMQLYLLKIFRKSYKLTKLKIAFNTKRAKRGLPLSAIKISKWIKSSPMAILNLWIPMMLKYNKPRYNSLVYIKIVLSTD